MQSRFLIFLGALTAIIFSAGCGTGVRGADQEQGEFRSYVDRFEKESLEHGRDLKGLAHTVPVQFGETKPTDFAVCRVSVFGEPTIDVNKAKWGLIDEVTKEQVIYHELGHCILHREHDASVVSLHSNDLDSGVNVPKSVMNPYLVPVSAYQAHRSLYVSELFAQ